MSVTSSGLIYLFGEEFCNPERSFGSSETLVYSGKSIDRRRLSEKLFEAAVISLAEGGYITLRTPTKSWLHPIFSRRAVVIKRCKSKIDDVPPSLERKILVTLREPSPGRPLGLEKDRVKAVVMRVIQEVSPDPWMMVVNDVKAHLMEAGFIKQDTYRVFWGGTKVQWSAHMRDITPYAGEMGRLKASMVAFARLNRDLHKKLTAEVKNGINAQLESSDEQYFCGFHGPG